MEDSKRVCKNCETKNSLDAKFCKNCGQKTDHKLNINVLFYNTIGNYFSFDARFFKSIIPLLFKPGYIAKEFVNGRRLRYLHPGQMYLFVSVIFFFVFNFYVREQRQELDQTSKEIKEEKSKYAARIDSVIKIDSLDLKTDQKLKEITVTNHTRDTRAKDSVSGKTSDSGIIQFNFEQKEIDSLMAIGASDKEIYKTMGMEDDAGYLTRRFYRQYLKLLKKMDIGQVFQTFVDSIPIALFILMPLFAFFMKLFYFKKGNYSHHLVFSFYYFCFLFTVFSFILGVNYLYDIPNAIDWIIAISTFFYFWRAIIKFYGSGWFVALVKSIVISWLYLFFVIPLAIVLMIVFAFFYF